MLSFSPRGSKALRNLAFSVLGFSAAWSAQAQTAASPFSDLITEPGGAGLGLSLIHI